MESVDVLGRLGPLLGYMGAVCALTFTAAGAAAGTSKAAAAIAPLSSAHPGMMYRSLVPVIQSGVLALYGLIVAVLIVLEVTDDWPFASGCLDLAAGLAVGLPCLFAGRSIGEVGAAGLAACKEHADKYVAAASTTTDDGLSAQQPLLPGGSVTPATPPMRGSPFMGMVLCCIYAEAIGLYGLIVALIMVAN